MTPLVIVEVVAVDNAHYLLGKRQITQSCIQQKEGESIRVTIQAYDAVIRCPVNRSKRVQCDLVHSSLEELMLGVLHWFVQESAPVQTIGPIGCVRSILLPRAAILAS